MKPLVVESGVEEERFNGLMNGLEDLKENAIALIYNFLKEIFDTTWKAANHIKSDPNANWDYYKLQEIEDMPEQIILRDCLKELKKSFRRLPRVYRPKAKKQKSVA